MSDFENGFGGIGRGADRRIGRPAAPTPKPADTEDLSRKAAEQPATGSTRRSRDPFDLDAAFARLRTLLAFDGNDGPREGIPRRGFYLNILT